MNFVQYLAMTNRTSIQSVFLRDWERLFLTDGSVTPIHDCNDLRMLQQLEKFALRTRAAATQLKFDDLVAECDIVIEEVGKRAAFLVSSLTSWSPSTKK